MADRDEEQTATVRATISEMARSFADLLKHPDADVRRAAELSLSEQFLRSEGTSGEPRKLVADLLNRAGELAAAGLALGGIAARAREQIGRLGMDPRSLRDDLLTDAIRASIPNAPIAEASRGRPEQVHAVFTALRIATGGVDTTEKFLAQTAPLDPTAVPRLAEMLGFTNPDKAD